MNKEELKKEAEEWLCNNLHSASEEDFIKAMVDIAEPREKRIDELEEVRSRQAELINKDTIRMENQKYQITKLEKENAELKSENQKWKDEWQEQVQKSTDEGYARTLQTMQLTKATKIIKELCGMVRELNKPNVQLTNVDYSLAEAEQFIKDSEGK